MTPHARKSQFHNVVGTFTPFEVSGPTRALARDHRKVIQKPVALGILIHAAQPTGEISPLQVR